MLTKEGKIMAKRVYIVSKTHLDLGYTNLAQRVVEKYLEEYIPHAIQIAKEVNKDGKKFVWTLGSWLVDRALRDSDEKRVKELEEACMRGDVVAHALPFTLQSELADTRLFEDGLHIVKELDKRFNRTTIAAKMTDVPGHTMGIVPLLAKYGIKLLHIGVNRSSAVPSVPPCFVWQCDGAQVIVIYEGSYGGTFTHPALEEILVFDHSTDNCGPRDAKTVLKHFERVQKKYKDYEVVAGTLDDFAEKLWEIKDQLPVVKSEIGDTWIHGASSDPYKYGALRMLEDMRNEWLRKKAISPDSEEYRVFTDNLLCLAEHTAGRGILNAFRDYDNYLKPDFMEARKRDAKIPRYGLCRLPFIKKYMIKRGGRGRYSRMIKSWNEQRDYITKAIEALPMKLYVEAFTKLKALRPDCCCFPSGKEIYTDNAVKCGKWTIELNRFGAPKNLKLGNIGIISDNECSLVDYKSIGPDDFKFWLKNYQRDLYKTFTWAIPDFARPKLNRIAKLYPQGAFPYLMSEAVYDKTKDFERVTVRLAGQKQIMPQLGLPRKLTVQYIFFENYMQLRLEWTDKDVSRLPEEIWLHIGISPDKENIFYHKLGQKISPYSIVRNGSRNLSVTEGIDFDVNGKTVTIKPRQAIPVSLGKGKLLHFDNVFQDSKEGISFLLQNNIWGTNYPLWYEDNASMWFDIALKEEFDKGFKSYEPKIQVNVVKAKALENIDEKYNLTEEEKLLANREDREKLKKSTLSDDAYVAADVFDEKEFGKESQPVQEKQKASKSKTTKKPAYSGLGMVKPIKDRATVLDNDDLIEPTDDDDDVSTAPKLSLGSRGTFGVNNIIREENGGSDKPRISIQPRASASINLGSELDLEDPNIVENAPSESKAQAAASKTKAKSASKVQSAKKTAEVKAKSADGASSQKTASSKPQTKKSSTSAAKETKTSSKTTSKKK